jgi:hypothetical protein
VSPRRGIERWIPGDWLLLVLCLLCLLAAPRAARAQAPGTQVGAAPEGLGESDYAIGEKGHRFRVRFDPLSRISLGVAGVLGGTADAAPRADVEVSAGLSYRRLSRVGLGKEQVIWQFDSRVLSGYVRPVSAVVKGAPALDAALYHASLLRHDESPSIVLPVSPPASIPFPFDIGFESELGRVYIPSELPRARADGVSLPMLELGVMRAALILDPWRTGTPGKSLEIGIGARYDISTYFEPARKTPKVVHRVAPMTAASLRFRIQSQDGLALLDCRTDIIPHWTSESVWKLAARSTVHFSRTLIAINDQPIDAVFEGGYRLTPKAESTLPLHDVRVSLGLSFNLQLK